LRHAVSGGKTAPEIKGALLFDKIFRMAYQQC
jgi:hypothetical protein